MNRQQKRLQKRMEKQKSNYKQTLGQKIKEERHMSVVERRKKHQKSLGQMLQEVSTAMKKIPKIKFPKMNLKWGEHPNNLGHELFPGCFRCHDDSHKSADGKMMIYTGGWISTVHVYPSELAQAFWTAIFAFSTCFVVTLVLSVVSRPREDKELVGLVYSLTDWRQTKHLMIGLAPMIVAAMIAFWPTKENDAGVARRALRWAGALALAVALLFNLRADAALIRKMEGAEITLERLDYVLKAYRGGTLADQVYCAFLGPSPREDFIPYVADFFLQVEDAKWTVIAGVVGDTLVISVRNLGYSKNAGEFVRRFFSDIGSAGGHRAIFVGDCSCPATTR